MISDDLIRFDSVRLDSLDMIHIKRVLLLLYTIFRRPSVEVFMEHEQGLGSRREVKCAPHSRRHSPP